MGYTDFNKAKSALIEHKVVLYQEQQEYQDIQQGENQQYDVGTQPVISQPMEQKQQYYEAPIEVPIEEPQIVESPVKIQINKPKVELKIVESNNSIANNDYNIDDNSNMDNNSNMDSEIDEKPKGRIPAFIEPNGHSV